MATTIIMKEYHFSIGLKQRPRWISGHCDGRNKKEALEVLIARLPEWVVLTNPQLNLRNTGTEYLNVYFNPQVITTKDLVFKRVVPRVKL